MIKPHYGLFLGVTVTKDTDIEDEADEGKVEWEQKMEWEDRIANKEKETIVRNYIDTLWNKRHVICEKDLKALGLLSFVYKDLDFEGRIEKLVKELTEQKLS